MVKIARYWSQISVRKKKEIDNNRKQKIEKKHNISKKINLNGTKREWIERMKIKENLRSGIKRRG